MPIEDSIVDVFGRWYCVNHGPSTLDESLDFRGIPNKAPLIGGETRNRTHNTVYYPDCSEDFKRCIPPTYCPFGVN